MYNDREPVPKDKSMCYGTKGNQKKKKKTHPSCHQDTHRRYPLSLMKTNIGREWGTGTQKQLKQWSRQCNACRLHWQPSAARRTGERPWQKRGEREETRALMQSPFCLKTSKHTHRQRSTFIRCWDIKLILGKDPDLDQLFNLFLSHIKPTCQLSLFRGLARCHKSPATCVLRKNKHYWKLLHTFHFLFKKGCVSFIQPWAVTNYHRSNSN